MHTPVILILAAIALTALVLSVRGSSRRRRHRELAEFYQVELSTHRGNPKMSEPSTGSRRMIAQYQARLAYHQRRAGRRR